MFETIFFILFILGIISVIFPPLGVVIIQLLSMPIKIVFSDIRITGTLLSVLIILLALGVIEF